MLSSRKEDKGKILKTNTIKDRVMQIFEEFYFRAGWILQEIIKWTNKPTLNYIWQF